MKKAYKVIENPENWTKGANARNKDGIATRINDPDACKFCVIGAIGKVYDEENRQTKFDILMRHVDCFISAWNDAPQQTHDVVYKTLKKLKI